VAELNIDQQRAMALAQARLRLQDAEAPTTCEGVPGPRRTWSDVPADIRQNLPASAQRFYGGLVEAFTSPIQTAKSFADLAAGGLRAGARAVLPRSVTDALDRLDNPETTARISEIANTVGGEYAKNYGSLDGIRDKIAEDPVGFLSDMSLILTGGAGAATKAGAVGTATTLGRAARLTDPLTPVIAPIQLAGRAAGKAADVAYDMTDPMARAYADAAAGRGPEIVQALRNPNAEFVPGSRPLTSQLAATAGAPEFAAFSRMGEERIASELARRLEDQSIARQSYMQQVSGAPANPVTGQRGAMEAAKEARTQTSGAAYRRAEPEVYRADATIETLFDRPSIRDALSWAEEVAREKGQPFTIRRPEPPAAPVPTGMLDAQGRPIMSTPAAAAPFEYSVRDLDRLQKALKDYVKENPKNLGVEQRNAITATRRELLDWIDNQSEAYKAAREGYAEASGPINRMAVGREIQNALTNPLTGEASRASTFASAIENAPRTIKRSTGESRFSYLSDVLTPDDIKVVQDIQKDLMRAEKTERSVAAGRRADIPDITRTATEAAAGAGPQLSLLNRAYTLAQNIYRRLEGKVNREVADQIARDLLDPSATAFQLDRALRREANRAKTVSRIETPFQTTAAALRNPAARGVPQVLNAMNPYEDPFVANAMTPR
jgi:hypothetical protein